MLEVKKDVEVGLNVLKGPMFMSYPNNYNFMYCVTNEDISRYYNYFPIEGRNVLTIASSGDHILEAMKYNASSIYAFDKNKFAIYMSKIKIAAVKALSYEEFISFFGDKFFIVDLYKKIRECLDDDTRFFWDELYRTGKLEDNLEKVFLGMYGEKTYSLYHNQEERYSIIKKNSDIKIKYIDCDFFELDFHLDKDVSFGSIFLSNIPDWMMEDEVKKYYRPYIRSVLDKHLDDDGMVAAYAGVFQTNKLVEKQFKDSIELGDLNKVYIYKKCGNNTK